MLSGSLSLCQFRFVTVEGEWAHHQVETMGRTEAADGAESGGLGVGETVRELREAYEGGRTRSLAWRQAQLRGLLRLLEEKEVEAFQALHKDLGKHHAEAYRDEVASRRQ